MFPSQGPGANDEFAKCLTEKGAVFYGAFWCPACGQQKEMFGSSVQYLNYVECSLPDRSGQTQICIEKGIDGYPRWILASGEVLKRVQSLETLALKTGCSLNPSENTSG